MKKILTNRYIFTASIVYVLFFALIGYLTSIACSTVGSQFATFLMLRINQQSGIRCRQEPVNGSRKSNVACDFRN